MSLKKCFRRNNSCFVDVETVVVDIVAVAVDDDKRPQHVASATHWLKSAPSCQLLLSIAIAEAEELVCVEYQRKIVDVVVVD